MEPRANSPLSTTSPRFIAVSWGGTIATTVWACGWIWVTGVAFHRMIHAPGGFAFLGLLVSVSVAGIALGLAWGAIRSDHRAEPEPKRTPQPLGRRIIGFFSAVFWCAVAIAWNYGVFGMLLRAADQGHGILLAILLIWSVIGWILLTVLFVSLAEMIDWIRSIAIGE